MKKACLSLPDKILDETLPVAESSNISVNSSSSNATDTSIESSHELAEMN